MKNKYVERLVKEWDIHGKIIIGVDFDDTISPYRFEKGELQDTIDLIKEAVLVGAYVVIFTACKPHRYKHIKEYCKNINLYVDSINENPIKLPFGNQKKIYANIFLDDRGGLEEAKKILRNAMYIHKNKQDEKFKKKNSKKF